MVRVRVRVRVRARARARVRVRDSISCVLTGVVELVRSVLGQAGGRDSVTDPGSEPILPQGKGLAHLVRGGVRVGAGG